MEEERISRTQLTSLVWAGVLAPAAELLPGLTLPAAGKGAWLAPLAALPLVLAGGWLMGKLGEGRGLAARLAENFTGKAVLILYMVGPVVLPTGGGGGGPVDGTGTPVRPGPGGAVLSGYSLDRRGGGAPPVPDPHQGGAGAPPVV